MNNHTADRGIKSARAISKLPELLLMNFFEIQSICDQTEFLCKAGNFVVMQWAIP